MGHSTVSFSKKGKLTYTEILKAFDEKASRDREEYGYSEHPDSFYRAESPTQRYLGKIYSPEKAHEIMGQTSNYESFCLYTIPRKVFMDLYSKEYVKINKIREKIKALQDKLILASDENLTKLGLKGKVEVKKEIFFTTPCCNSKINVHALSKYQYNTPTHCPICRSTHNEKFEHVWRDKVLGKAYGKLKAKITGNIEKLQKEIKEIEIKFPDSIDESKLTKKQKEEIITLVFADIHH